MSRKSNSMANHAGQRAELETDKNAGTDRNVEAPATDPAQRQPTEAGQAPQKRRREPSRSRGEAKHAKARRSSGQDKPPVTRAEADTPAEGNGQKPKPFPKVKEKRLQAYQEVIRDHLSSFSAMGEALRAIRDEKLYLKTHKTFDAYCSGFWDMDRTTAYKYIAAASAVTDIQETAKKMSTTVDTARLNRETLLRPLVTLKEPKDKLRAYQKALKMAGDGPLTVNLMKEATAGFRKEKPHKNAGSSKSVGQATVDALEPEDEEINLEQALDWLDRVEEAIDACFQDADKPYALKLLADLRECVSEQAANL